MKANLLMKNVDIARTDPKLCKKNTNRILFSIDMDDNQPHSSAPGYIQSKGPSSAHVQHATERFMTVNQGRLARVREGLQPKQQQCFDLLPLLFHINHESLPGYSSRDDVPFGISNYHPSDTVIRLAQSITRGQVGKRVSLTKPALSALYLMGSSGSIGQSTSSDLDIWVCYNSELNDRDIDRLQTKAEQISVWASGFNLEVHFFLMDAHRFSGGEQQSLTGENCGSTQHVLLLDEFYRTVQVLAGNIPAWWLVPTAFESEYRSALDTMAYDGYVNDANTTDFGPIATLPAGEFIGAGMWQIYKAIDSPYKSVLKLILLEIYAREYPAIESLAHQYKSDIYRMKLSLDDLDPYVMLYRRIESYLTERDEMERLALLRRCFYFKVGLNLSKPTRTYNWRRELMDYLLDSWGWTKSTIAHLDNFRAWTIEEVLSERRLLINELTHSYRFLTEFASEHHSTHVMSQRDLLILSRKLHAAFDRRPGKIDFIRIGLDVDLSHEKIRLYERESKQEPGVFLWAAYNRPLDADPSPSPLKYSKGLLETLLWSHLNGLISAHLHIPIYPMQQAITEFEIRMLLASMRQILPTPLPKIDSNSFYHPAILTKVVCFINVGRDPLHYLSARGLQKISARSNSLDFSALRENLVLSIDMVLVNTWGEVVVERFADQDAMTKALKSLINRVNKQTRSGLPIIETVCHNQTRPQAIAKRVKDLFEDALSALCSPMHPKNTRFVFNLSDNCILFQHINRVTNFQTLSDVTELEQHLGHEQAEYSPVVFDRVFQQDQPLMSQLYQTHSANTVNVAFELQTTQATLYLIDEQGSLMRFVQPLHNVATLLSPLLRFLKVTEHRQRSNTDVQLMPQRTIQCHQIVRQKNGLELKRIKLGGLVNKGRFISVQVNVDLSDQGGYDYHVVCNEKEFHSAVLGDNLYNAVASFVLGLRASGQKYPVYITDLALTESVTDSFEFGRDQTRHYVSLKLKLEKRINDAMKRL
ncbi:adenylate cyclase, class I [Reinekea sp. MED297]|uniref:Adenylate cyclase, class I n=2 Tax=Reinekea TaxID=230494 RepID=A4BK19_9GAMM|nr:adenylate cyclase, class I [Reinekea sp. MED297] [Reinekea blandensis MED297]